MMHLQFVIGCLLLVGSSSQEHVVLDRNELNDVMNELKLLRSEVAENRKRTILQENELKAVKLELEEIKRHCSCEPNSSSEMSALAVNEDISKDENSIIQRNEHARMNRIIPPTDPPVNHDEPIAFYAYMSSHMNNIGGHHALIFDVIKANPGLGLHPTTGVFTAPKSGFYVFTWTIRVYYNNYHSIELVVNGQVFGALYEHSGTGDDDMGSTTAVVYVSKREDVFLRTRMENNQGGIISNSNGYSSFAGWKLS